MKHFISCILLIVFASLTRGQQPDNGLADTISVSAPVAEEGVVSPPVEYTDEEDVPEPLYLPKDSMDKIRKEKDYAYMKNLDSLLRNFRVEAPEPEEEAAPSKSIFSIGLVKLIIWGAAIFAVLYILYQLLAGQQNLFYKNKKLEPETGPGDEAPAGTSPLILSQQAAARGDYRLAVRYQYLYILQLMGEKQIVILQPQKSDAHYQQEVRGKPLAPDFSRLTLQYEYVWYGEFSINQSQFETISGGYRKFIETWL